VDLEWSTLWTEFEPGTSAKQYSLLRPLVTLVCWGGGEGLLAVNRQSTDVLSASTSAVLNEL